MAEYVPYTGEVYNVLTPQQQAALDRLAAQGEMQSNIQSDAAAGQQFGQQILGTGLGRLGTNKQINSIRDALKSQSNNRLNQMVSGAPQISQQDIALKQQTLDAVGNLDAIQKGNEQAYIQQAQQRLQNIADQGLSREELQAQREQLTQQLQRAQQTASRTAMAQQGQAGVQGAVAGRQLQDINMQAAGQRANIARDLFLQSEQIKREGAQNLANFGLQRQSAEDQRNQAFQQMNLQRGTTLLQANQARSLNQANLNAQQQLNQANLNMQRIQANENMFQGRQSAYENALANQMSTESQIATFDLGQAANEKKFLGQMSLGYASLGSAERGSEKAAQASAQAAANQGGGGKIICTELHRQGLLNDEIMKLDAEYGIKLRAEKPHVYDGYVFWAQYVVIGMRKSKNFTKLVAKIATPWALHMAYNNNKLGRIINFLGEGICGIIGKVVGTTKFQMKDLFEV